MQRSNPEVFKRYNCKRWRELRKYKLILNPLCERCLKKEKYNAAYIVHHKEYVTQENYMDDDIFYNIDNLESVCLKCHNQEHFSGEKPNYYFDKNGNIVPIRNEEDE